MDTVYGNVMVVSDSNPLVSVIVFWAFRSDRYLTVALFNKGTFVKVGYIQNGKILDSQWVPLVDEDFENKILKEVEGKNIQKK